MTPRASAWCHIDGGPLLVRHRGPAHLCCPNVPLNCPVANVPDLSDPEALAMIHPGRRRPLSATVSR